MNNEAEIIDLKARQKLIEAKMDAIIDILSEEGMVARVDFEEEVEKKVNKIED